MVDTTEMHAVAPDANFVSMADFVFGSLGTDERRVAFIKRTSSGVSHNYEITPRDPKPGQPVQVTVSAGPNAAVTDMFIHFTTDGSHPSIGKPNTGTIAMMRGATQWNTLLWGYTRHFTGEIPGQNEGTIVRYQISGITQSGDRFWAEDMSQRTQFSYVVDRYQVPAWVNDAVIYHIFVDRFASTPGRDFNLSNDYSAFFGGTLKGILNKLDYLSELGVNTLWLSPIYPSPSHHGYDYTNLRKVEPRLGNNTDVRELVTEIHRRKMRILFDFVPNHTSNRHPFFESAQRNPDSPYRDYYTFKKWPDDYSTFFGVKELPQLNNENPVARQYVIESALYWQNEFGIDGFRLDYAQGPSHDFWTDYYTAMKKANPQSFHFGEITQSPEYVRTYEGIMDGALDFSWLQAARKLMVFGSSNVAEFEQFQGAHEAYFVGRNFARLSFLDNHDMNRFLWVAHGDKRRLMQAAAAQFTLGAVPVIYYGTEVGVSQRVDVRQEGRGLEESRGPMLWGASQDADLLRCYQRLIKLRKESTALRQGTRWAWLVDPIGGRYGYLRRSSTETMAIALNTTPEPRHFDLPSVAWRNALTGEIVPQSVDIGPYGYVIVKQG